MTEARMQETPHYAPGAFCWVELGTNNAEAAKKFYTSLFGWSFDDVPAGPSGVYTMLKLDGKDVGALYQLSDEMLSQHIPTASLSYILVSDANEAARKAKEAGGVIAKDPFDVMDVGRMAVILDPTGAAFAVWEARKHQGAGVVNVPNSFCWNELTTPDTTKAGDFYTSVFGWEKTERDMGRMIYTTFLNDGRPNGGMFAPTPEMGNIPPNWLVYFAVDDCDAVAKKAEGLGSKSIWPPMDIEGVGRFSVLQDPTGAAFGIIKLLQPTQ